MKDIYYHETDEEFDEFWKNAPKWVKQPVRLLRSPAKNRCIDSKRAEGKGGKTSRGECRSELGGNIFTRGAKRVGLAPARGAFLQLVKLNYRGLASRLNRAKLNEPRIYNEAISKFVKLGGSANAFKKAINFAKNKKPIICGSKCKEKFKLNFSGDISLDEQIFFDEFPDYGYHNVEPATLSVIIGGATAILVPIINIVKNSRATKEEARLNAQEAENTKDLMAEQGKQEQQKAEAETKMVKSLMIGGSIIIGVLVTGAIVMKVVKRKRSK